MANPTGFMKTERETPTRRPVDVRIRDWKEVYEEQPLKICKNKLAVAWIAAFHFVTKVARSEI